MAFDLDTRTMQLDQLRYFIAVAGELHFRRAAERLHISQPPLSFHIKALELEVGTQLLNRNTRQVSLTEAGAAFLVRAKRILADVAEAAEEVKRISTGRAGSLRIGFTISTSFHPFFCDSVFRYRRAYPEVMVRLSESVSERQIDALLDERLDVGFLRGRFDQVAGLTMTVLTREALVLALHRSHPLAAKARISTTSLRTEPFISYPANAGVGIYRQILALCERAGFEPRIIQEALEPSVIMGLVAAGLGVAIVPSSLQSIKIGDVVFVPLDDPEAVATLYVAYRSNDDSPRVNAFADLVARVCSPAPSPSRKGGKPPPAARQRGRTK
jgi:DNA-binding transcriptional LysR family regulator